MTAVLDLDAAPKLSQQGPRRWKSMPPAAPNVCSPPGHGDGGPPQAVRPMGPMTTSSTRIVRTDS